MGTYATAGLHQQSPAQLAFTLQPNGPLGECCQYGPVLKSSRYETHARQSYELQLEMSSLSSGVTFLSAVTFLPGPVSKDHR